MRTGPKNLITDVAGLRVGHAQDPRIATGVTVALFEDEAVASVAVTGGAPAGRDLECLAPEAHVEAVHAILLSGGSGFGLDAASGAQAWLRERGRGIVFGRAVIPITPQAICFDLLNGGDKDWGRMPPYWEMGWSAAAAARSGAFDIGSAGAGFGATTATLRGGVGSASATTASGFRVGALAVVNAIGSATIGDRPQFWAAPFEQGREFGGLGMPATSEPGDLGLRMKGRQLPSTTIAVVVTDAALTKPQSKRLALMADDGLSKAIRPAHAPMDGDTVFAVSTLARPLVDAAADLAEIGAAAGDVLARAIARGVYEAAAPPPAWTGPPAHRQKFRRP